LNRYPEYAWNGFPSRTRTSDRRFVFSSYVPLTVSPYMVPETLPSATASRTSSPSKPLPLIVQVPAGGSAPAAVGAKAKRATSQKIRTAIVDSGREWIAVAYRRVGGNGK
jgi:hypothetical protein